MRKRNSFLFVVITLFSFTFIFSAQAQECAPVSFKQTIEKMDSFSEAISVLRGNRYAVEQMYTKTTETADHPGFAVATIHEEVLPELYTDPEYVQLKNSEQKVRNAYIKFVIPLIAKSQNIAELLYFYEYDTEDSLLIEEVVKNKTFQNFTQAVATQIDYKVHSDSSMEKETIRTPRGYSFWERDTMILEIFKTFVIETLKPVTQYSATEIVWILHALEEYGHTTIFTDTVSVQTKKLWRAKVKNCWAMEEVYSHSDMFLDPDN